MSTATLTPHDVLVDAYQAAQTAYHRALARAEDAERSGADCATARQEAEEAWQLARAAWVAAAATL